MVSLLCKYPIALALDWFTAAFSECYCTNNAQDSGEFTVLLMTRCSASVGCACSVSGSENQSSETTQIGNERTENVGHLFFPAQGYSLAQILL